MIMVDTPDAPAVPPETIHVVSDAASGLEGVIVLHSTRRGPAAGGCRLWRYADRAALTRSEEHTSELQSLMRISYAVFCLKKKKNNKNTVAGNNRIRTSTKQ